MAMQALHETRAPRAGRREVHVVVEEARGQNGRSWEDDTVKLRETGPRGGGVPDTILLDESDLEDVVELAAGASPAWWLEPDPGCVRLGGRDRGRVAGRLRAAMNRLLFRLGWGYLEDDVETATRPPASEWNLA